ncbi:hypothetical protein E3P96_03257 [Wallemia ichthyophaga]|nr:hypothetical protein E3P96_03257 [Wallemia ichthyophaga]
MSLFSRAAEMLPSALSTPSNTSNSPQPHKPNDGITNGVIAAVTIASVILVAALLAIITYVIRTRRDIMEERKSTRFANSVGKRNVSPTLESARAKLREKLSIDVPISRSNTTSSFGDKDKDKDGISVSESYDEEADFGNWRESAPQLLRGFSSNSETYTKRQSTAPSATSPISPFSEKKTGSFIFPPMPSTPTYIDDLPQSPLESPTADVRTVKLAFMPTMSDEIAVVTGDTVLLLKEWDDGWAYVVKLNKEGEFKEEGVIPLESLVDNSPQSRNFAQSVKQIPSRMSLVKPSKSSIGSRRSGVRNSSIRV